MMKFPQTESLIRSRVSNFLKNLTRLDLKPTTIPKFFAAATFSSILLLALFGLSAIGANAQQMSRITIRKDFCNSVGASNTCNGVPNNAPSNVTFNVDLGTFDGTTFTVTSSPSPFAVVDVAISASNANGATTTQDIFPTATFIRVCEDVPNGFTSIPRPENSGGGASQFSQGSCLIAELGPGNNSLKFINLASGGPTAADGSISGRVVDAFGDSVAKATVTLVNAATGETNAVRTDSFGHYVIRDLAAGGLYFLRVSHKRFVFTETRTVTLNDNLADIDFVANL
ncbi:MAG: carboxypeptidase-like regulatory domain-containing protein [Pyrinomonadaceae bacterium]